MKRLIFAGILFLSIIGCANENSPSGPDGSGALVAGQEFVKRNLQCPSTAKFPWDAYSKVVTYDKATGIYTISSYVDAQNAFGATIRANYVVTVKDRGADWVLEDIIIE